MDDGRRRRILTLGLALAVAGPAPAGPGAAPPPDEEFGALLEFLGDPELASDDWTSFFDSLAGGVPPEPAPPAPVPAPGASAGAARGEDPP